MIEQEDSKFFELDDRVEFFMILLIGLFAVVFFIRTIVGINAVLERSTAPHEIINSSTIK